MQLNTTRTGNTSHSSQQERGGLDRPEVACELGEKAPRVPHKPVSRCARGRRERYPAPRRGPLLSGQQAVYKPSGEPEMRH